jgi:hypothetical protein
MVPLKRNKEVTGVALRPVRDSIPTDHNCHQIAAVRQADILR